LQAVELHQLKRHAGGRGGHPVGQDLDHRFALAALQLGIHVGHPALEHRLAGVLVHRRGPAAGGFVVVLGLGDRARHQVAAVREHVVHAHAKP
jgi:hypothetical protein